VIKKLVKTYGGSILRLDQMMESTSKKLKQFGEIFGVSEEELAKHYRVFVPYNNQLS